jgi:osmoprotectant transport system ATP-binding protein
MIELQNLSKTFQSNGKRQSRRLVSLTVNEGEICVFLGPRVAARAPR